MGNGISLWNSGCWDFTLGFLLSIHDGVIGFRLNLFGCKWEINDVEYFIVCERRMSIV